MNEQKIFYSKYQFPRKELTQSLLKQICSDGFVAYGLFKKRRSGKTHFLYSNCKNIVM